MEWNTVSNYCRTCMKEVTSCEQDIPDKIIFYKFTICTNIKIPEDDKLPKQFCVDCISKIETSYTFIMDAKKIDEVLKNIYNLDRSLQSDDYASNVTVKEEPVNNEMRTKSETTQQKQDNFEIKLSIKSETDFVNRNINEIDDVCRSNLKNDDTHLSEFNSIEVRQLRRQNNITQGPFNTKRKTSKKINIKGLMDTRNIVNKTTMLTCAECKKEFNVKSTYYRHMANEHSAHMFKCDNCPKTFATRSSLNSHAVCHITEKLFPCPTCGKRFKRRMQLRAHARAHSDSRPYECDVCHMRFKFKSALQGHIIRVHQEKKEYLCTTCGLSFARAANLEVHMRTHTGEKPYSCTECGHRSITLTDLRRHQRRHTGVKAYICSDCGKSFYDKGTLNRHKLIHTGELPFKCPHCEKAFNDSWKRKVHLVRVHHYIVTEIPKMARDGQTIS